MMKTLSLTLAGAAAIATLGGATFAFAQTKPAPKPAAAAPKPAATAPRPAAAASPAPAAPAPAPLVITANIPGICVYSQDGVIAGSNVGKAVLARLQQLQAQVNAELTADATSLQNDAKAYEAKKATLAEAAQQQQAQALQTRAAAFDQKRQQRQNELQATEQKAFARVLQEAGPLLPDLIKGKACAVVLDANAILAANEVMNLTPVVVTALNGKIQTFDFDREHLDPNAAPAQR